MVASPEHIFAMKALAARARDIDDLRSLAALAAVYTVDDALRICRDFYPNEEVSSRAVSDGVSHHGRHRRICKPWFWSSRTSRQRTAVTAAPVSSDRRTTGQSALSLKSCAKPASPCGLYS